MFITAVTSFESFSSQAGITGGGLGGGRRRGAKNKQTNKQFYGFILITSTQSVSTLLPEIPYYLLSDCYTILPILL